jgi:ABC-type cobalt transport system substrate-binding protein
VDGQRVGACRVRVGCCTYGWRAVPPVVALPLAAYTIVLAYNADAAYGNKMERVNKEFNKITTQESHWFTPIDAPQSKK